MWVKAGKILVPPVVLLSADGRPPAYRHLPDADFLKSLDRTLNKHNSARHLLRFQFVLVHAEPPSFPILQTADCIFFENVFNNIVSSKVKTFTTIPVTPGNISSTCESVHCASLVDK